ncbi:uncharacterized protein DS421_2g37900 [Arachis hypogaea]|nr:uncharacterized protein DS421_2g37900 [Arachis hypogaea]
MDRRRGEVVVAVLVAELEKDEERRVDLMVDFIEENEEALCAILLHAEAIYEEDRENGNSAMQRVYGFHF